MLTSRLAPTSEGGCVNITPPKTRFLLCHSVPSYLEIGHMGDWSGMA